LALAALILWKLRLNNSGIALAYWIKAISQKCY